MSFALKGEKMYKIYWKNSKGKLSQMNALQEDFESVGEAIQAVKDGLNFEGEKYFSPVLALIQGGKK